MTDLSTTAAIAVRQAGAYTDLILSDLDVTSRVVRRRMVLGSVMILAIHLALLMGCVWVVAVSWESAFRVRVIAGLAGAFVLIAGAALWRLSVLDSGAPGVLQQTAREWAKDRRLLEKLLSRNRVGAL